MHHDPYILQRGLVVVQTGTRANGDSGTSHQPLSPHLRLEYRSAFGLYTVPIRFIDNTEDCAPAASIFPLFNFRFQLSGFRFLLDPVSSIILYTLAFSGCIDNAHRQSSGRLRATSRERGLLKKSRAQPVNKPGATLTKNGECTNA